MAVEALKLSKIRQGVGIHPGDMAAETDNNAKADIGGCESAAQGCGTATSGAVDALHPVSEAPAA